MLRSHPALRALLLLSLATAAGRPGFGQEPLAVFAKPNLVAWCIVPFDARQRNPQQRAEMIRQLGLSRVAYDWRDEHVASFEEEIIQYKRHGIEFFAFWSWHPDFAPLVRKHGIRPQFWLTNPSPRGDTQQQRIERAAQQLLPIVAQAGALACPVGLYNHGDWGGEPDNLIAVCRYLRENHDADHVGIVYNLHHGHEHIDDFALILERLKPLLLCLNLNGMNDQAQPKILPIGQGAHDRVLLRTIVDSGYQGPIGILDHRPETDARESLQQNLEGLDQLARELRP